MVADVFEQFADAFCWSAPTVLYLYHYLHSCIGIVHKDIQSPILFSTDFIKQLFDFLIIPMVTFNWDALTSTLLAYLNKYEIINNYSTRARWISNDR